MFTSAEKTVKTSSVIQRQTVGPFFTRKYDAMHHGGGEKSFLGSSFIQPKLNVSHPDDPQEKEADQMANRVMTMPEAAPVHSSSEKKEGIHRQEEELQNAAEPEEEKQVQKKIQLKEEEKEEVQRSSEEEMQRKQEERDEAVQMRTEEKDEEQIQALEENEKREPFQRREDREEVQTKLFDTGASVNRSSYQFHRKEDDKKDENINRKEIAVNPTRLIQRSGRGPPSTENNSFKNSLTSARGTGSPLPDDTRSFMENRFNADFSGVRVHNSESSVQMNRDIHAQAFTYGNDIFFNSGKFSPGTSDGRSLIAHELTHTIQQGASHHISDPAQSSDNNNTVAARHVTQKKAIQRSASNLAAAVAIAKAESGKVSANKKGPDGFRYGWSQLMDYFKTTLGPEKIIPDGQAGEASSVPESNIKNQNIAYNVNVVKPDGKVARGERDAMPSWCGIFAFWALNKAGLPMKKWTLGKMTIPPEAAVAPGVTPSPGFLAYRDLRSHYGLVERSDGTSVTSINGNTAGDDNLGGEIQVQTHEIGKWTAFIDPMKLIEGAMRNPEMGVQEKPKSLHELRKELFGIQRKRQSEDDQNKIQPDAVKFSSDHHVNATAESEKNEELKRKEEKQEETDKTIQPKTFVHDESAPSGISVQRRSAPMVQRGIFSAIGGAISSAVNWVGDKLEEGKKWLLKQVTKLIMKVPGYKALRVALGEDPITGEHVERNGKNFIDAALDIMPFGTDLKQKMEELGILEKAELFVDKAIGRLKTLVNGIFDTFSNFWDSISLSDLKNIPGVFSRLENAFTSFFNHIKNFVKGIAGDFLEFIKQALLIPLGNYIKSKTRFWDLLCLIMGKDPLTDEPRPVNGTNILNAFLNLSEWGEEQRKKMMETGTFNKVAAWIDKGIAVFSKSYQELKAAFTGLWDYVNIKSLMNPTGTFTKIFNSFWKPIERVGAYVLETGFMILKIVKDVLFKWISKKAGNTRGYFLITVLINKDPFTGEKVPRTTENIIKGFMVLTEGGEEQFNRMKESGAMDRATQKIDAAVKTLGFTWNYVKGLFIRLWESFKWKDLVVPLLAFVKVIDTFKNPVLRLIRFIITVITALFEIILRMMGFPVDLVFKLIDNVIKAWNSIKSNPSGFFMNVLKAIKQGFLQFFDNIINHLLDGLKAWLKQELMDAGVPIPTDFTFMGIIKWLFQVLDITMEKIWKKLEARIGKEKVGKIRNLLAKAEAVYDKANEALAFIEDIRQRGMVAIYDKIKEKLSNIWDLVFNAVKSFIMDQIIKKVTAKLLSMLDPTGIMAVINSAIALYKAIQSFIKYLARILEIVNSFVEGIIEICVGNISSAAMFLENSLARGLPVVIGFLANQVGLNLSDSIRDILGTIREKVDQGLDFLIDKLVSFAENIITKVKAGIAAVKEWWRARATFRDNANKEHTILFEGENANAVLSVRSETQPYTKFLQIFENTLDTEEMKEKGGALKLAKAKATEIEDKKKERISETDEEAKKKKQQEKEQKIAALVQELAKLSEPLFGTEKPKDWKKEFQGGGSNLFATTMLAERIYKNPRLIGEGSLPTMSKHAIYDALDLRKKGTASYYIRGHLLNHNLGGPGKWDNMTALSRSGNHQHESNIESIVKAGFDSGTVVSYSVKTMERHSPKEPVESDKPKFTRIPDVNKHFESLKKIIQAEQNVPKALQGSAFTMKKSGENWEIDKKIVENSVPNEIETDYSTYEVGDSVPVPVVNLSSGENADKLYETIDYAAGHRQAFINRILAMITDKKSKENPTFGSYDALADYQILYKNGKVKEEFTGTQKNYITGSLKDNPNVKLR